MYSMGKDSKATMLLLMHGASRLNLDGFGAHLLPAWVNDDQRPMLLHDLYKLASTADNHESLSPAVITKWSARFKLLLLDGVNSAELPHKDSSVSRLQ